MSDARSPHQQDVVGQAVSLVFGLAVLCGLLLISIFALGNAWLGVIVGAVELVVAWRVSPPEGVRSLRWVTGLMGAFTMSFSVLWLLVS